MRFSLTSLLAFVVLSCVLALLTTRRTHQFDVETTATSANLLVVRMQSERGWPFAVNRTNEGSLYIWNKNLPADQLAEFHALDAWIVSLDAYNAFFPNHPLDSDLAVHEEFLFGGGFNPFAYPDNTQAVVLNFVLAVAAAFVLAACVELFVRRRVTAS